MATRPTYDKETYGTIQPPPIMHLSGEVAYGAYQAQDIRWGTEIEEEPAALIITDKTLPYMQEGSYALVQGDELEVTIRDINPEVAHIFDMQDATRVYSEEDLYALRVDQAEKFHHLLGDLGKVFCWNTFLLGWMMLRGEELGLHTYLGYDNMKDWASEQGIPTAIRKQAIALIKIWPYLQSIGIPPREVTERKITMVQAEYLAAQQRDINRQKNAIKGQIIAERYPEVYREDEREPEEIAKQVFKTLPVEEQQSINQEADPQYLAQAKAAVLHTLDQSDSDLIYERERTRGEPIRPAISFKQIKYDPETEQCTGLFSFECSPLHIEAIRKNQFGTHLFYVPGFDTYMTPKEFAEHITSLDDTDDTREDEEEE